MVYTRRRFLRDTAAVSVASAVSGPFSAFAQPGPSFSSGVRLFFLGAWMLAPGKKDSSGHSTSILAITNDLGNGMHRFPFGPWVDKGLDAGKSLSPNPPDGNGGTPPYTVTVPDTATSAFNEPKDLTSLFTAAMHDGVLSMASFAVKSEGDLKLLPGIRRVSVPIPTRIISAVITTGFAIDPGNVIDNGNAFNNSITTGFILDYQNAMELRFGDDRLFGSQASSGDYHFHTVPHFPPSCGMACMQQHTEFMFTNLMETLVDFGSSASVAPPRLLHNSDMFSQKGGHSVPSQINPDELGIEHDGSRMTTASCASGGGLLGGCGC